MKTLLNKKLGAGFMIALMNVNVYQAAAAQSFPSNPQLMKDIHVLDSLSKDFNTRPSKDKKRVESMLSSFESLMGRKLALGERTFLSLQFSAMEVLPRFEVKGNTIQVYDMNEGSKDLLVSLEVLDVEKNTFKFGKRTFQVDPKKPIHENIQLILKELQKGEGVSFLQQLNFFGIPQAQAEMAPWVKFLLVGGIALVVGILIGKSIQKNKNKNDAIVAESSSGSSRESSESGDSKSENDHGGTSEDAVVSTDESVESTPAVESVPTSGEEPATV